MAGYYLLVSCLAQPLAGCTPQAISSKQWFYALKRLNYVRTARADMGQYGPIAVHPKGYPKHNDLYIKGGTLGFANIDSIDKDYCEVIIA